MLEFNSIINLIILKSFNFKALMMFLGLIKKIITLLVCVLPLDSFTCELYYITPKGVIKYGHFHS